MLTGSILTSNSTLNNFRGIESLEIFRGEEVILQIRLLDRQTNSRYIPPTGAVVTLHFNNNTTLGLDKIATTLADDRSMASVTLSEIETADILSGDLSFSVQEGTVLKKGVIVDAVRILTEGC